MTPGLESRVLSILRYALDNPGETFRKAAGMAWLGEAYELVRELETRPEAVIDPPRLSSRCAQGLSCRIHGAELDSTK